MFISDDRLDRIFGDRPEPDVPKTAVESAMLGIRNLDRGIEELVEEFREPGETPANAYARLLQERPEVYDRYLIAKNDLLKRHGLEG